MKVTEYVPTEKMGQFHTILCATGGRYLRNPLPLRQHVKVYYEPGDYKAQCEAWERCVTPDPRDATGSMVASGVATLWPAGLT